VEHDRNIQRFEEIMGSNFITELKIREGQMKQNLRSRDELMH
jgi:hypothetical protein